MDITQTGEINDLLYTGQVDLETAKWSTIALYKN